jgi:hypothetical protein
LTQDNNEAKYTLTAEDIDALRAYVSKMDEHEAKEPPYSFDTVDYAKSSTPTETPKGWQELGYSSHKEYADDPARWQVTRSPCGEAWEAWNKQGIEITNEYEAYIRKALLTILQQYDDAPTGDDLDFNPSTIALLKLLLQREPAQEQLPGQTVLDGMAPAADDLIADIPQMRTKPPEHIFMPLDKINSNIWGTLSDIPLSKIIPFATEKHNSAKEATVLFSIDWKQLEEEGGISITDARKLGPFDERCYEASAAIYNAGDEYMTASKIYQAMGNTGRPSTKDIQKINESLDKMQAAHITIDNEKEIEVNKHYARFPYDGPLLPFERRSAIINNVLVDSAIHLFREPPLINFARTRGKQFTTVGMAVLESPISKTPANLLMDNYLLKEISRIKSGKRNRKMLYTTIFEKCHVTGATPRRRAKETLFRYLNHYKQTGFIKGYSELKDGISISC